MLRYLLKEVIFIKFQLLIGLIRNIFSGKFKSDDNMKMVCKMDVDSGASGAESSLSPNDNADDDTPKVDPLKWSVSCRNKPVFTNFK